MLETYEKTFDLTDPVNFHNGHPFSTYDEIRRTEPVYRNPSSNGAVPIWVLTKHADVNAVARDNENYTSTEGFRVLEQGGLANMKPEIREAIASNLLTMDPPEHAKVRRPMQSHFMPSALCKLEKQIQAFVNNLVTSLPADSEVEFVTEVASIAPIQTLCLMLGIPKADQSKVFDWTNQLVGTSDPEFGPSIEESGEIFEEVFEYGTQLLKQRRSQPGEDLLSTVAHMFDEGSSRSQNIQRGMFTLLLAAGNETTRNSLSGSIVALSRFPEQRRQLCDSRSDIARAIPELLRFISPVMQMKRVAVNDIVIAGQDIHKGDSVAMLYGAANRDPAVFDEPNKLDLQRSNANQHLSFGIGIHHCLGARIATMQLNAILRALLTRFPDISIADEPEYLQSNFVCGIKKLAVNTGREQR